MSPIKDIHSALQLSLSDDWVLDDIQLKWCLLESKSAPNTYLSWHWINSWLSLCPKKPLCLQASYQGELVGLGFLYPTVSKFLSAFSVRELWLHRIGCDGLDQIWIEHNDFLLDSRFKDQVRERIVSFLQYESGYHELYYGLSADKISHKICTSANNYRVVISAASYSSSLSDFSSKESYLSSLSKNTRSQIVRTEKLITEKYGDIELSLASTETEKTQYLGHAASLHQQRWSTSEFGSGFDNKVFTQFHRGLIVGDTHNAVTRLYQLKAGEEVFGYIYLLTDAGSWKFYLSAIRFDDDNRIKVGLLFHALVIAEAIKQKVVMYDFLAGEARYKKSLSNIEEQQLMYCFYKPSLITRVRESLRAFKKRFLHK